MKSGDRTNKGPKQKGNLSTTFIQPRPTNKEGMAEGSPMDRHKIEVVTKKDGESQIANLKTPY